MEASNNENNSSKTTFNEYLSTIFQWDRHDVLNSGYSWKETISLNCNLTGFTCFKYHIKEQLSFIDPTSEDADHKRQRYLFWWKYQELEAQDDDDNDNEPYAVGEFDIPPSEAEGNEDEDKEGDVAAEEEEK